MCDVRHPYPRDRGFTLIELLIVVAIIAILAAIAVPNFMNAQIRSKVSRTRSDMRSIAGALEAYFLDHNTYPASEWTGTVFAGIYKLTTPVAYIATIPTRPFAVGREGGRQEEQVFEYGAGRVSKYGSGFTVRYPNASYMVEGAGPDQTEATRGDFATARYPAWPPNATAEEVLRLIYDPSNGTRSFGSIFRGGGEAPSEPALHLFYTIISP